MSRHRVRQGSLPERIPWSAVELAGSLLAVAVGMVLGFWFMLAVVIR